MTPAQKIKAHILQVAILEGNADAAKSPITAENIDERFDAANENWQLQDYISEFREGEVETDIKTPYSRHYEAKSVARKMGDGCWIGWTYWYGGGKHSDPESIPWIDDAYALDCVEEQKMVTVLTFSQKVEQPA